MALKLSPRGDRVVVMPAAEESMSAGGIVLAPSANKEKPQKGTITAVGKGKMKEDGTLVPMDLKVGDQVLYGKYSGTEFKIDGEEMLVLREDDVMAIIEEV